MKKRGRKRTQKGGTSWRKRKKLRRLGTLGKKRRSRTGEQRKT